MLATAAAVLSEALACCMMSTIRLYRLIAGSPGLQASLGLKKAQAECIALAARNFRADSQQLQRQRTDCLASLKQASPLPCCASC